MKTQTNVRLHSYPDIEKAVLGSIINEHMRKELEYVSRVITKEVFTNDLRQDLYQLVIENKAATYYELILLFAETKHCKDKNANPVLAQAEASFIIEDLEKRYHLFSTYLFRDCMILAEATKRRGIQEIAYKIAMDGGSIGDMSHLQEGIDELKAATSKADTIDNIFDNADIPETIRQIEHAHKTGSNVTGLDTGYEKLNEYTSGFQPSDLIYLGGRPGMGKSTLAINIADRVSKKEPVVWFNYESNRHELRKKLFSINSKVLYGQIRRGKLSGDEWRILNSVAEKMYDQRLALLDYGSETIQDLEKIALSIARKYKIGLFIIDYLQLIETKQKHQTENAEVQQISRTLKRIAKTTGVPVLALSQLNREVEKTTTKRPGLGNLRSSGAIEQDGDLILFVYRPEEYGFKYDENGNSLINMAELIIAKNKNGSTGSINFTTDLEHCIFTENSDLGHIPLIPTTKKLDLKKKDTQESEPDEEKDTDNPPF